MKRKNLIDEETPVLKTHNGIVSDGSFEYIVKLKIVQTWGKLESAQYILIKLLSKK